MGLYALAPTSLAVGFAYGATVIACACDQRRCLPLVTFAAVACVYPSPLSKSMASARSGVATVLFGAPVTAGFPLRAFAPASPPERIPTPIRDTNTVARTPEPPEILS